MFSLFNYIKQVSCKHLLKNKFNFLCLLSALSLLFGCNESNYNNYNQTPVVQNYSTQDKWTYYEEIFVKLSNSDYIECVLRDEGNYAGGLSCNWNRFIEEKSFNELYKDSEFYDVKEKWTNFEEIHLKLKNQKEYFCLQYTYARSRSGISCNWNENQNKNVNSELENK